jgi:predicted RNA-binding protein (virulence factor B family)
MKYTRIDLTSTYFNTPQLDKEILLQLQNEHQEDVIESFTEKGKEKIINEILTFANQLSPYLQVILDAELRAGNKIQSASMGYPEDKSISVTLEKRFINKYKNNENVTYTLLNDPHYWNEDYATTQNPVHLLIS